MIQFSRKSGGQILCHNFTKNYMLSFIRVPGLSSACVCGGWAGSGIAFANKHIGLYIEGTQNSKSRESK